LDFNNKDNVKLSELFTIHPYWGKLPINGNLPKPQPIFTRLEMPEK
jgi:hypothetical protein